MFNKRLIDSAAADVRGDNGDPRKGFPIVFCLRTACTTVDCLQLNAFRSDSLFNLVAFSFPFTNDDDNNNYYCTRFENVRFYRESRTFPTVGVLEVAKNDNIRSRFIIIIKRKYTHLITSTLCLFVVLYEKKKKNDC